MSEVSNGTPFKINIFQKIANFTLDSDRVSPHRRIEYILILQSLSFQDQKPKSKNNPILYKLRKQNILIKSFSKIFRGLFLKKLLWSGDPVLFKKINLFKLTTEHEELFWFYYLRRNRFDNTYCHGENISEMTDNTHK